MTGGSVFDDELQWVKRFFEKWSHCERAIAVCCLLKQFQYPTLRFIQSKIEATYAQSTDCDKNKWMEQKSNDKSYISELCDSYKSLTNTISDVQLNNNYNNNNNNITFSTKEDILTEILNRILMLKIGNDDVIQEYLALIPFMVDDTHRGIVNVEVVMQTLSILVAHPALSSDDLR